MKDRPHHCRQREQSRVFNSVRNNVGNMCEETQTVGDVEGLHNAQDAFMFTIQPRAALVALSGTCIYWHLHYIKVRQDQNIINTHAVICIVNQEDSVTVTSCGWVGFPQKYKYPLASILEHTVGANYEAVLYKNHINLFW